MPPARLAHLDGLRGAAAAIVAIWLCADFVFVPLAGEPETSLRRILAYDFNMANAGFTALFALSGYLIPYSFGGAHAVRDFILKRGLRLYPTFLVAGLLALCLLPYSQGIHLALRQIVKSFVLMHPLTTSPQFDHSHWLLVLLLAFYAEWLVLAAANLLRWRRLPIVIAFALLALGGVLTVIGALYHRHFPILALLCLAIVHFGWFVRQHREEAAGSGAFGAVITAFWGALLLIVAFAWSPHWGLGELWIGKAVAFAAGAALFLFGVLSQRMTAAPLIWLSDISYAAYFFLPLLLSTASRFVSDDDFAGRMAAAGVSLGVAAILSAATVRFVAKPAVDFGHRLTA